MKWLKKIVSEVRRVHGPSCMLGPDATEAELLDFLQGAPAISATATPPALEGVTGLEGIESRLTVLENGIAQAASAASLTSELTKIHSLVGENKTAIESVISTVTGSVETLKSNLSTEINSIKLQVATGSSIQSAPPAIPGANPPVKKEENNSVAIVSLDQILGNKRADA